MSDHWDLVYVGCGAQKQARPAQARHLYTGPVFRAHWAIAAHLGVPVNCILSAKHGAVGPFCELDPYECKLTAAEARAWGEAEVDAFLASCCMAGKEPSSYTVLALAGADYVDSWAPQLRALGVTVDDPLRGLEVGERLQFARELCDSTPARPESYGRPVRREFLAFVERFMRERAERQRRRAQVERAAGWQLGLGGVA